MIAQKPESAEYDGMPRSAIATGLMDYILPPAEMPAQIIAYAGYAFDSTPFPAAEPSHKVGDTLKKICLVLRDHTGHDFSQYKQNTFVRRVERRMAVHQIERMEDYLRHLRQNPAEAEALFGDLLIGVTSFFRDPEAFAVLESKVVPRLFEGKPAGAPVRVWVCACASGEEAYSIAILLQEHIETLRQSFKIQVFATDIDSNAISQARAGIYPPSIAADISPERLARFFDQAQEGGVYRIRKTIRDLMVFSEQDVIRDPPFSKLDLISCRNLLIYLNGELQKKLIPLFHYALAPLGTLFLGTSETVGEFGQLFVPLDRKWKVYGRQDETAGAVRPGAGDLIPALAERLGRGPTERPEVRDQTKANLEALSQHTLMAHYAQVAILVDSRGEIYHIHGRTGKYLEAAPGAAAMNILSMAREGLRRDLSTALHRMVRQQKPICILGLRVKTDGADIAVNLTVRRAGTHGGAPPDLFLVILEEVSPPDPVPIPAAGAAAHGSPESRRIAALELELRTKEEYLQTSFEEMETSNEELKSINEEMQSVNEEMQSTNEELENSKEELQSVNEELATVNNELQTKVVDLSRSNNDMNNLLAGTGVATLFVDHQLRIVRFTPTATELINLIQSDIGRPVSHIVSNISDYHRLVEDVRGVLHDLTPREVEVHTKAGKRFLLRIRPYRTMENVIEGAVITFTDVTELKRTAEALRESEAILETAMNQSLTGIAIADVPSGKLRYVNEAGLLIAGGTRAALVDGVGMDQYAATWRILDLDGNPLPTDAVPLARAVLHGESSSREYIIRRAANDDRLVSADASPITDAEGKVTAGIVIFQDITERRRAALALHDREVYLHALLRGSPVIVAHVDRELRYTWVHNPHPDFHPESMMGKRDDEIAVNDGTRQLVQLKRRVIETGVTAREEIAFPVGEGTQTYAITAVALKNAAGEVAGAITVAFDITGRQAETPHE